MNQAILFPDREEWDDGRQSICFPALVGGFQVNCALTGEALAYRFGGDTPEYWLESFRQHRWDLEEEAEKAIREQQEDDQGWIWLS
ncbi:DUF1488 domain-containing protein [Enterobacter sp. CC120223-11]|uniref:DUF1488 domain-containing protein n=1 Tax=Enterobacter sp. CC120223-11 TaxID=1378073 RepID=UPI000BC9CE6F|nr:DUF1488 domain-containing protein [Enterobacter sp. CC120223-11]SNY80270.1 Protein of unknown function [Enterobacter sp. CC120223-11]